MCRSHCISNCRDLIGYMITMTTLFLLKKLPKWRASAKDYRPPECYEMDMETRVISAVNTVLCQRSLFIAPTSVYATFQFTPPGFIFRRKIFGDIQYNFKVRLLFKDVKFTFIF